MREKGWFVIPGKQSGDRSLAEQLKGLDPALAEAAGKSVLDLGCAEGLIALEMAKAGALRVYACDCNPESVEIAKGMRGELPVTFETQNVNVMVELGAAPWRADIVLALAILHKLRDPVRATQFAAAAAGSLLVIRHQGGSKGMIKSKWTVGECDSRAVLEARGFALERECHGPRDELVHYWRRA